MAVKYNQNQVWNAYVIMCMIIMDRVHSRFVCGPLHPMTCMMMGHYEQKRVTITKTYNFDLKCITW